MVLLHSAPSGQQAAGVNDLGAASFALRRRTMDHLMKEDFLELLHRPELQYMEYLNACSTYGYTAICSEELVQ